MKFCILVVTLVVCAYSTPLSNQAKKTLAKKVLKEVFLENQEQMKNYIRQMVKDTVQANSKKNHVNDELENIFTAETESETKKLDDENKNVKPDLEKDISSQENELLGNENETETDKEVVENEIPAQNFKDVKQIAKLLENVPKELVDQYYKEKADQQHEKNMPVYFGETANESSVSKNEENEAKNEEKEAKNEEIEKQEEITKKEEEKRKSSNNKFKKNLEKALNANRSTKDSKNGEEIKKYLNTKKETELVNDPTLNFSEDDDIHLEIIADGEGETNDTKIDNDKSENHLSGEEDGELDIHSLLSEFLKKELKEKINAKVNEKFNDSLRGQYLQKRESLKARIKEKMKDALQKLI